MSEGNLAIEGGTPIRKLYPWFTSIPRPMLWWDDRPMVNEEEVKAVMEVARSHTLSELTGTKVREFEKNFAEYCDVKHAIACSSDTAAMYVALAAIGVGVGDEVIVPAYTFIADAESVLHRNAVPIFADIDPRTFNIDPDDMAKRITSRTKAVLLVHHDQPADMKPILEIAKDKNVAVIEDCALALGVEYYGKKVGTFGDAGTFSFSLMKPTYCGEGGMITTNDDELAEKAIAVIHHGLMGGEKKGYGPELFTMLGFNFRMTDLQGAIGIIQLRKVDKMSKGRSEIAKYLTEHLQKIDGIIPPYVMPNVKHAWTHYRIKLDLEKFSVSKDKFCEAMTAEGVPTSTAFRLPLYEIPVIKNMIGFGYHCPYKCPLYKGELKYEKGLCPNTEKVLNEMITPPFHYGMSREDQDDIIAAIKKVANAYRKK